MTAKSRNMLYLSGRLTDEPCLSHTSHGETFMRFPLEVERLSGTPDTVNVLVRRESLSPLALRQGDFAAVTGELRSFNNRTGVGSRLVVCAYAKEIAPCTPHFQNELELSGVICKPPVYRRTPLGREICDIMLAINRHYGRADYLPCIVWGRNASIAAAYEVGTAVDILGRIQSRNYIKVADGQEQMRVTYEVSVSSIAENG